MGVEVLWYADQRDRAYVRTTRTAFVDLQDAAEFAYNHRDQVASVVDGGTTVQRSEWWALGAPRSTLSEGLAYSDGVIDQASAKVLASRWLAFIRNSGSVSPTHASFQYLGGDVTDAFMVPNTTTILWSGADWYDGTTVVTGSDTYAGVALPVRNGAIQESTQGTFTNQLHKTGNAGVWLDAVADGGNPAGRIWWPMCLLVDGGSTMRVGCLLVAPATDQYPYGVLESSQIVTINVFGSYASHATLPFGSQFKVDGWFRDTTHTYMADVRHRNELSDRYTQLARVINGSLLTFGSWEFWAGSGWSSNVGDAVPMLDIDGAVIVGDSDIAKIADGRYLLVAHAELGDPHVNVYKAAAPQGPWQPTARVPLPGSIGHTINDGWQISQIPRVLDSNILIGSERPPAEHSTVLMSRNLLGFPLSAWPQLRIDRFAPQFVNVPHN